MANIRILSLLAVLLFAPLLTNTALGQRQNLISGQVRHGGYGGPMVQTTWVDGNPGILVGGSGAWIINGTFAIGGMGVGLATTHEAEGYGDTRHTLEGGYGGLTLEYFHRPQSLVHFSAGTLLGAGGVAVLEGDRLDPDRDSIDETAFFVARPYAGVSLNVTDFFQLFGTGAYRLTVGSTLDNYNDAALSGPEFGIGLRFGSF